MKNSRSILMLLLSLFLTSTLYAQNYQWGNVNPGNNINIITATAVDQQGAIYNIGGVRQYGSGPSPWIDLDPSTESLIVSDVNGPHFIQKLDKNGNLLWGGSFGDGSIKGSGELKVYAATTDARNNVYFAGSAVVVTSGSTTKTGIYDMDVKMGAADTFMMDPANGAGFVTKLDENGNLLWAINFADNINEFKFSTTLSIEAMQVDAQENVYLAGYFSSDSSDFDPGVGETKLTNSGGVDAFILKLDKDGNFKWVGHFGGSTGFVFDDGDPNDPRVSCACDQVKDIVVDDSGNVYLTGIVTSYTSSLDIDPGIDPADTFYVNVSGTKTFLTKLDSNGTFVWGQLLNGTATNIFLSNNNEVITVEDSIRVFNSNGDFLWAKNVEQPYDVMTRDENGRFYFTGSHPNGIAIDYDPGPSSSILKGDDNWFTATNIITRYVLCMNGNGSFAWVAGIETSVSGTTSFTSLNTDDRSNLFISGYLGNDYIDADPAPFDTTHLNLSDGQSFTIKWSQVDCDTAGATFGTTDITACDNYRTPSGKILTMTGVYNDTFPNSIGCDSILTINLTINPRTFSNIKITACDQYVQPITNEVFNFSGVYRYIVPNSLGCDSLITLDLTIERTFSTIEVTACDAYESPSGKYVWDASDTYFDTLVNDAGCDSILTINLTIVSSTFGDTSVTSCSRYTSPSGNHVWTASGVYQDSLMNQQGCDSFLTIDVTILTVDTTVTIERQNGASNLMAEQLSATYQWLDCSNNEMVIDGATGQFYQPDGEGSFAVEITTVDGCKDTTGCVDISTSVGTHLLESSIAYIYPNPMQNNLFIKVTQDQIRSIQLANLKGQVIKEYTNSNSLQVQMDVSALSPGGYVLTIQTEKELIHHKVMKK